MQAHVALILVRLQNQRGPPVKGHYWFSVCEVSCLVEFLIRSVCCWMACWTTALGSARWGRLRENSWSKRCCEDGKVCSRGGKDGLQLQRARLPLFCCSPSSYRWNGTEVTTSCPEQNKALVFLTSALFVSKWIHQQPRVTCEKNTMQCTHWVFFIFLFCQFIPYYFSLSLSSDWLLCLLRY